MERVGTQKISWTLSQRCFQDREAEPMMRSGAEPWLRRKCLWLPRDATPWAPPEGHVGMERVAEIEVAMLAASIGVQGS